MTKMVNLSLQKPNKMLILLCGFFITNALLAEFIGVKVFSLEKSLGFIPFDFTIFGEKHLSFNLTTGVLLWPIVFITTDIINEYYGRRIVKKLSYFTICLILYAFIIVFIAIHLMPADFWPTSHLKGLNSGAATEVVNLNTAFSIIYGQGQNIIIGSVVAFLISQLGDVFIFHRIKKLTGEKWIWLRATGSTLISQLIDSFVVLYIAFYIGAGWSLNLVLAISFMNYIYKITIAILMTPILYLVHYCIDQYLGKEQSLQLRKDAIK